MIRGAFAAAALSAGCSLGQPMPDPVRHELVLDRGVTAGAEGGPVLRVGTVRVAQRYAREEMVYRTEDAAYERDPMERFAHAPSAAIRDSLIEWLTDSGRFAAVLDAGSLVEADYVLEGRVRHLYVDVRRPDAPMARVELEAALLDSRDPGLRVLHREVYVEEAEAADASGAAAFAAITEVLRRAFGRLEADTVATATRARASPVPPEGRSHSRGE